MENKITLLTRNIENIGSTLRRTGWVSLIESFLILILGVLIVIEPSSTIQIASYCIGGFLAVRGLYQIITYFLEKGYNDFFNNNLLAGVICCLLGILFLFTGEKLLDFFRIALGIVIIYTALSRINLSIKLHSASIKNWFIPLLLSLVSLILGLFILLNENSAIILAGWFLITSGIMSAISDVIYLQDVNSIIAFFTKPKDSKTQS